MKPQNRPHRIFVIVFLILSLGIIGTGWVFYVHEKAYSKKTAEQTISAIADLKTSQFVNWRKERLGDTSVISTSPFNALRIRPFLENPSPGDSGDDIRAWMETLQKSYDYHDVVLTDTQGRIRLSVGSDEAKPDSQAEISISEAIRTKKPVMSDFHRSEANGFIHIELITPLLSPSESGSDTVCIGVLILRIDPNLFLYPLIQSWPTPSPSAETLLIRRNSHEVVYLNELRHRKNTALSLRLPITDKKLPAAKAVLGFEGIFEGTDYRNIPVLAAIRKIPDCPWSIVAKVDCEEIYAQLFVHICMIWSVVGGLILLLGLIFLFWWKKREAEFYRRDIIECGRAETAIRESERVKSEILDKLNDAQQIGKIGSWDWDLQTNEVWWSDETYRIFGVTPQEFVPSFEANAKFIHPDDLEKYKKVFENSLATGQALYFDLRLVSNDGIIKSCNAKGKVIYDDLGNAIRFVGTVMDITDRRLAEETLHESEKRFQSLFESMIEGVALHKIIYDDTGMPTDYIILAVNPAYQTHTGILAKDAVGKKASELYGTDKPPYFEVYRKVALTGIPERFDVYFEPMRKHFSISVFSPAKEQFATVFKDITERKRTEAALRESEERYSSLVENQTELVCRFIPDGTFIFVNDAYCHFFKKTKDELIGKKWHPLPVGDDITFIQEKLRTLSPSNPTVLIENRVFSGKGDIHWMQFVNMGFFDYNGDVLEIQSVGRDITERKQAEEEILKEKILSESIISSLPGIFYFFDEQGKFLRWNKNFEDIAGCSAEEFARLTPLDLFTDSEKELVAQRIQTVFREGKSDVEAHLTAKDGKRTFYFFTGCRVMLNNRYFLIGVGQDITERRRAEEERLKLEDQLRQAQKMEAVGQLAGGVAHDFNNLLYVITGYSDMMMEELPAEGNLSNNLKEIMKAAQRATTLVRQLLLFSRREAMQPKYLDMNQLISDLMKMLRRVIGEHISMNVSPGYGLRTIHADPGQIEQVLMNLCVNARDAMPDGGMIVIETENISIDAEYCERYRWAKEGDYVLLTVSDTGCGIPHEMQDHVFEPFFTTKEVGKGTGLGLAAVYGIVRSHGGLIHLYSEPGKGTSFKIYIPAAEEHRASPAAEKESAKPVSGGRETVLVAEDEESVRSMMIRILQNAGYRVFSAQDGEEAISLFRKHSSETDLALLDVVMPKVSGQKVYEQIAAIRPDMPVIFVTGYSRGILDSASFPANNYEVLQKPCLPADLLSKIRMVLDRDSV